MMPRRIWREHRASRPLLIMALVVLTIGGVYAVRSSMRGTTIVYAADWKSGPGGWRGGGAPWTVQNGMAVFDGTGAGTFVAPIALHRNAYTVRADIRVLGWNRDACCLVHSFGILVRADGPFDPGRDGIAGPGGGVYAYSASGLTVQRAAIFSPQNYPDIYTNDVDFRPGHSWHQYQVILKGNTIKMVIDGHVETVAQTLNRYFLGTRTGLISLAARIEVAHFSITT